MNENFPPMDIFSPDDDVTIRRIIEYLEEFQRKRDAIIHVSQASNDQFRIDFRLIFEFSNKLKGN
jgi:hypothetical protein